MKPDKKQYGGLLSRLTNIRKLKAEKDQDLLNDAQWNFLYSIIE